MTEYLRILEPIVSTQQHEKTKNIVKQFTNSIGLTFQQYLIEKQNSEDNWVRNYYFMFFQSNNYNICHVISLNNTGALLSGVEIVQVKFILKKKTNALSKFNVDVLITNMIFKLIGDNKSILILYNMLV